MLFVSYIKGLYILAIACRNPHMSSSTQLNLFNFALHCEKTPPSQLLAYEPSVLIWKGNFGKKTTLILDCIR